MADIVRQFPSLGPPDLELKWHDNGDGSYSLLVAVTGTVAVSSAPSTPVTGTFWQATQPVSVASVPLPAGAAKDSTLTDGTLRGSVSVSNFPGSQAVTGPLTDSQLRASPVPVSGTVTATGPLTDTQLRATAVPVDGSAVTQPVSASSLPLPAGAATDLSLQRIAASLNDISWQSILQAEQVFD